MASSRLSELSTIIAEKTALIEQYLASKGLPQPSFKPNAPAELGPIAHEDDAIQQARLDLIDATKELRDLAIGPSDLLRYQPWEVRTSLYSTLLGVEVLDSLARLTPNVPIRPPTTTSVFVRSITLRSHQRLALTRPSHMPNCRSAPASTSAISVASVAMP